MYSRVKDCKLGMGVSVHNYVNAYGCEIGGNTTLGSYVEVQKNAKIGKNCKISSHTFICTGVEIKDGVFVGHNVSFIVDRHPSALNEDGSIKGNKDWKMEEIVVEDGASIGTSVTILAGIHIGKNAVIGAGSVVTKNVPDETTVIGNPAKILTE